LAAPIIDGVLRRGHKLLLAGPSKAGKSFLLLQLAIAIAEGREWLGWQCARGRVLYVNLELDRASAYHRLAELYHRLEISPDHAADIDLWNLRGKAMPMTELAPRLIRRAAKRQYAAVIIDPIYKVITGDENAAHEMAKFCNQFDRVCAELGVATVYCHHHSKGDQGAKRAHDRASGSGVFARDPDALLDLIELEIDDHRRNRASELWQCQAMAAAFDVSAGPGWRDACPDETLHKPDPLAKWAEANGLGDVVREVRPEAVCLAEQASGWRVEGILREFPTFSPVRLWFRYPLHHLDRDGILADATAPGEEDRHRRQKALEGKQQTIDADTSLAYEALAAEGDAPVTIAALAEYLEVTAQTVKNRIQEGAKRGCTLRYRKGVVYRENAE
jgi:hypothetical protein